MYDIQSKTIQENQYLPTNGDYVSKIEELKLESGYKAISCNIYTRDHLRLVELKERKIIGSISDFIRQAIVEKLYNDLAIYRSLKGWDDVDLEMYPFLENIIQEDFSDYVNQHYQSMDKFTYTQLVSMYITEKKIHPNHKYLYINFLKRRCKNILGMYLQTGKIESLPGYSKLNRVFRPLK